MAGLSSLGYVGLFLSAFLAATILPLSSEVVLGTLYSSGLSALNLLIVASLGNVLGSLVNYVLGLKYGKVIAIKWLRIKESTFERASDIYMKWGKWSLLLAWVPVIGDPITLVAGTLRTHFVFFLFCIAFCKTARYAVLLYILS